MIYAIGDRGADVERQFDYFSTFDNIVRFTFAELMSTNEVVDQNASIILFFPYTLWERLVETSDELYGVRGFKESIHGLKQLLSSHPPLDQRIATLRAAG